MAEFVKVRRANEILRIKPSEVDRFYSLGYDVYNEDGTVQKRAVPSDVNTLKAAFVNHEAEIERLKAEIAELKKSKSTKATATKKSTKKSEE